MFTVLISAVVEEISLVWQQFLTFGRAAIQRHPESQSTGEMADKAGLTSDSQLAYSILATGIKLLNGLGESIKSALARTPTVNDFKALALEAPPSSLVGDSLM